MIKYGLISETDARTIEKTIDLILNGRDKDLIYVTEIGIYGGETGDGIARYCASKGVFCHLTGIDNLSDKEPIRFFYDKKIIGNSNEVYNQLEDNSQHLIFIDGCHCFAHVVSDFFCYAPKVKKGGCIAFHDTGKHIKSFKDFQHGDKENPDAYISVRKALDRVGLLDGYISGNGKMYESTLEDKWELIFDEADGDDEAGGICVFKKLY